MAGLVQHRSVVISSGQTTSGAVEIEDGAFLVGIRMPSAFTGTTMTFTEAPSLTGTYQAVYDSAGQISLTVAASRTIMIDPDRTRGLRFIKVVSGSSEGADRTIQVIIRALN